MAPKILRASPKPTGRHRKQGKKITGKPKGSSPSMILGSASKAGMQSKQGRNFLLPKTEPKRRTLGDPANLKRKKMEFERIKLKEKLKKIDFLMKEQIGIQKKIKMTPKQEKKMRERMRKKRRDL